MEKESLRAKKLQKRARVKTNVIKINENFSKLFIEIYSEIRDPAGSGWQLVSKENREARLIYDRFFKTIEAKAKR